MDLPREHPNRPGHSGRHCAPVRETRDPRPRRVDLPGLTTLTPGLLARVLALLRGCEEGWTSAQTLAELGAAAGLIPAFLIIEARSTAPMLPLGMFRVRPFAAAQLARLPVRVVLRVVPVRHIVNLNGYKIANPTILARIPEQELRWLVEGYGYAPRFVEGSDPAAMHALIVSTFDEIALEIGSIQRDARPGSTTERPRWPMIVLRTPKGWTGPRSTC